MATKSPKQQTSKANCEQVNNNMGDVLGNTRHASSRIVNHVDMVPKNQSRYSQALRRLTGKFKGTRSPKNVVKDHSTTTVSSAATVDQSSLETSSLDISSRVTTPNTETTLDSSSLEELPFQPTTAVDQSRNLRTNVSSKHKQKAETLVIRILEIHTKLKSMTCLKPKPEVNELFTELVGIAIQINPQNTTDMIMNDPRILSILPSLRAIASEAESHLETYWAELIIQSSRSQDPSLPNSQTESPIPKTISKESADQTFTALKQFPYYQNYIDLARMELSAITPLLETDQVIRKIAFIGSGPLPLTSICLSHLLLGDQQQQSQTNNSHSHSSSPSHSISQPPIHPLEILNIDSSLPAITTSRTLTHHLGQHAASLHFMHERAGLATRDLREYDIVFLAALVGNTQAEKEGLLVAVTRQMRKGALVVIRTSHGLRGLLYPGFEIGGEGECEAESDEEGEGEGEDGDGGMMDKVMDMVEWEVVVHPFGWRGVVNSVVVGRVR